MGGELGFMIGLTAALVLALIGSLVLAAVVLMIGDDPRTVDRPALQTLALASFLLPVTVGVALVAAWVCYFLGLSQAVIRGLSLLPLLGVGGFALAAGRRTQSRRPSDRRRE